jgi:hypothetical protein
MINFTAGGSIVASRVELAASDNALAKATTETIVGLIPFSCERWDETVLVQSRR